MEHPSPNGADARAAHAALAGRDRRGGPGAARPARCPDPRDRSPLRRQPRRRRGRLPARPRDPAHQGADHARGRARAVAEDGGQARGLRPAPPARAPYAGDRRRRAGRARDRPVRHPRAGRALRAAQPERRGAEPTQAPGDPLPGAARAGTLVPRDLQRDRLHLHQGEPLPDRGPAGAVGPARGDRGWHRVRAAGAAAVGTGRRRGGRRGAGPAAPAPEDLPELPRPAPRVPRRAAARGCAGTRGPAGGRRGRTSAARERGGGNSAEGRGARRGNASQGSGARRAGADGSRAGDRPEGRRAGGERRRARRWGHGGRPARKPPRPAAARGNRSAGADAGAGGAAADGAPTHLTAAVDA